MAGRFQLVPAVQVTMEDLGICQYTADYRTHNG